LSTLGLVRLVLSLVLCGCIACTSSTQEPTPKGPKASNTKAACANECRRAETACNEKCLEDESMPKDDEEPCATRCNKSLVKCTESCR
jgi:hypothetical protein